jgi:hypothetical protein
MANRILNTGEAKICGGCSKSPYWCATGYACCVFADPRKSSGYRLGECAFNMKLKEVSVNKVRVGQQKHKKS